MPVYSHSRLRVYETCPKQYEFQYSGRMCAMHRREVREAARRAARGAAG